MTTDSSKIAIRSANSHPANDSLIHQALSEITKLELHYNSPVVRQYTDYTCALLRKALKYKSLKKRTELVGESYDYYIARIDTVLKSINP